MAFSSLPALQSGVEPTATGVILAIDYGLKRLGLALSDERGVTSRPFATWTRVNRRRDLARLRELVREHAVRRIVVGLPLHLDGRPSEMSEEARAFAARVGRALGIPVEMMDERLSSWEAEQALAATKSTVTSRRGRTQQPRSRRKAPLDDVAAAVILRDYLDRARSQAGARD
jgi:putative Holliday junction resolvase